MEVSSVFSFSSLFFYLSRLAFSICSLIVTYLLIRYITASIGLNDEQKEYQAVSRAFADKEMAPFMQVCTG